MKDWFRFENAADDPSIVDIHIIDYIGGWFDDMVNRFWGVEMSTTAKAFVEKLAALDDNVKTIRLHINSPGGDVFAAVNIANALRDQQQTKGRTVVTIIDGLAASAATIIAMAGSTVEMSDNGLFMIHDPWTRVTGNADELLKAAAELEKITGAIIATYQWHSPLSAEDIAALMDDETWFDAAEAKDKGFVTDVTKGLQVAATIDPRAERVLNVPEQFRDRVKAFLAPDAAAEDAGVPPAADDQAPPASAADVLQFCTEAKLDLAFARALVAEGLPVDAVKARIASERTARQAEATRCSEIRRWCDKAGQSDLADIFIRGGLAADAARESLAVITAKVDNVEIDGSLDPDHRGAGQGDWKAAFARANRRGFGRR